MRDGWRMLDSCCCCCWMSDAAWKPWIVRLHIETVVDLDIEHAAGGGAAAAPVMEVVIDSVTDHEVVLVVVAAVVVAISCYLNGLPPYPALHFLHSHGHDSGGGYYY